MRYVNRIVGPDGKERLYFRKSGAPSRPLRSDWGSPELEAEVAAILAALEPAKAVQGTLKAALLVFEKGPDLAALAPSTQYEYGLILKELEADFGQVGVHRFTAEQVLRLRNAWAPRGHRATAVRLLILRHVLLPAIIAGRIAGGDPFAQIPAVRRPASAPEPHPLWPAEVLEAVVARALANGNPGLARAVVIARYVGARRGDLVKLGRSARGEGRFRFLSGKRRIQVDVEEDPALTAWLGILPDRPVAKPRLGRKVKTGASPLDPFTLVFNLSGRPYTEDGLGQELGDVVTKLAEEKAIDSAAYGLHGLRHTRGVELALAGCTDAQIAAQLAHASPSSSAQYRRQAERIRLADDAAVKVAQLRERLANAPLQNPVQK